MEKKSLEKNDGLKKEGGDKNKKYKIVVYVVVGVATIFILCAVAIPSLFSNIENNEDGSAIISNNKKIGESLNNIREGLESFGESLDKLNEATSTSTDKEVENLEAEALQQLKEKILEVTNQENE